MFFIVVTSTYRLLNGKVILRMYLSLNQGRVSGDTHKVAIQDKMGIVRWCNLKLGVYMLDCFHTQFANRGAVAAEIV